MSEAGTAWNFLVVEDNETFINQLQEILPSCVDAPDTVKVEICPTFQEATARLKAQKYDVLILDLKDDSEDAFDDVDNPAGLKIFDELKKTRFTPVVFYTALPEKVRGDETSFVRVVEKTEGVMRVKEEVKSVLGTQLPRLSRELEEVQRAYMWDFVSTHWQQFPTSKDQGDIAYLLARRLAISLEAFAAKLAAAVGGSEESPIDEWKAHPMILYVKPPFERHRLSGDIIAEGAGDARQHWMVLTPSCDFAQCKADHVVLAKCEKLSDQQEYINWKAGNENPSKGSVDSLEQLIGDNRKQQPERFKFLPGTFFLPDLVVDFQQLRSIDAGILETFEAIATLDSPFAEAMLARFSRYFGRVGTPDVDKQLVIKRLNIATAGKTEPT
jgi:CheY-like chemotaxis protein